MVVMMGKTWGGIVEGSKGTVVRVVYDTLERQRTFTVKFHYGEVRTVPGGVLKYPNND